MESFSISVNILSFSGSQKGVERKHRASLHSLHQAASPFPFPSSFLLEYDVISSCRVANRVLAHYHCFPTQRTPSTPRLPSNAHHDPSPPITPYAIAQPHHLAIPYVGDLEFSVVSFAAEVAFECQAPSDAVAAAGGQGWSQPGGCMVRNRPVEVDGRARAFHHLLISQDVRGFRLWLGLIGRIREDG